MTPICQNVHEEDSAQLKNLGVLSESTLLEYNDGLQVFISESALYCTQLKIWVGYQKAYL